MRFKKGGDPKETLGLGVWRKGYILLKPGRDRLTLEEDTLLYKKITFERKASEIRDLSIGYTYGEDFEVDKILRSLRVVKFKNLYGRDNYKGLFSNWRDRYSDPENPDLANVFLAIVEGDSRVFIIDTSGFEYARYMNIIDGFPGEIISESISSFQRGSDPKETLGLGIRYKRQKRDILNTMERISKTTGLPGQEVSPISEDNYEIFIYIDEDKVFSLGLYIDDSGPIKEPPSFIYGFIYEGYGDEYEFSNTIEKAEKDLYIRINHAKKNNFINWDFASSWKGIKKYGK